MLDLGTGTGRIPLLFPDTAVTGLDLQSAMLLENRPEFLFHYLALNWLGISIVPTNPDYRRDEMAYLLDHSDAELAVVLPHRVGDVRDAAAERAKLLPVVSAHAVCITSRPGRTKCGVSNTQKTGQSWGTIGRMAGVGRQANKRWHRPIPGTQ